MERPTNTDRRGQAASAASSGSVPAVGEPARHPVLLVEDHAALAEATAELMRLHGLEVWIASSGRNALSLAEELNPVLVLCDLVLPDMTGLDVAQTLRARPGAKDFLIVILSALSAGALREFESHTKASGITLFLPKPLTSEILIDLLSRLDALRPSLGPTPLA
jgi:CheY-like chemotaxis protein